MSSWLACREETYGRRTTREQRAWGVAPSSSTLVWDVRGAGTPGRYGHCVYSHSGYMMTHAHRPNRSREPPAAPASDVPHPARARRPGAPRLRHHPGRRGANRRRAPHERRDAVSLRRPDGGAGTHRRSDEASHHPPRRRAASLLPHHAVRHRGRARGDGASLPTRATRPRARPHAGTVLMPASLRFYRALLRLYPAGFRAEYRHALTDAFAERVREHSGRLAP